MSKTVRLGNRLRYPVTIQKIKKRVGDTVKKQEPLIEYSFKWVETVGDHVLGDTRQEVRTSLADWNSPFDGEIIKWLISEGDMIEADCNCLVAREACTHPLQFAGLCAVCGKDMTEVNWASETVDTARAPINMTHDVTNLTVSAEEAQRAEYELQSRLLEQRKLSLVVDLDQTIIHACIEPTIGEWQRDPDNPNYESVKDVKSFQLNDEGPRGLATGCWYYIKLRPGLEDFLRKISAKYELHVYTMGTRAYALNIAKLVDPEQKLFGNRVISRDENGNMTAKSLQRLFPVSTNMVVIIDDRADVWPRNRPNLIKVVPYDFFKGIGDINSSFLPKREDLLAAPPAAAATSPTKDGEGDAKDTAAAGSMTDKPSALQELVKMSGADNPAVTKRQIEQQAVELEKQIKDRPLLHLQEKLDKEDEKAENTIHETSSSSDGPQPPSSFHQRHQLLSDDDRELEYLEQHLLDLHEEFYREYDRTVAMNRSVVPDVGQVLDSLKSRVLRGTKLVLSGLVPIGMDVRKSELGVQVVNFGALLRDKVASDITHLIVSSERPRTAKVRQAAQFPSIKIVTQQWLLECLTQWRRIDETPHLVQIHSADRPRANKAEIGDTEVVSDADDPDDVPDNPAGQNDGEDAEPDSENWPESDGDNEEDEELEPDGSISPVDALKTFDWTGADQELDEFLASGSDDEGEDGDGDDDSAAADKDILNGDGENGAVSRKRKHDDDIESMASETDSVDDNAGSLAKKQRLAGNRPGSTLRTEYNAEADTSLPTPQGTGDEGDVSVPDGEAGDADTATGTDDDVEIDEDELEADILAEFEAEEQEERDQKERDGATGHGRD